MDYESKIDESSVVLLSFSFMEEADERLVINRDSVLGERKGTFPPFVEEVENRKLPLSNFDWLFQRARQNSHLNVVQVLSNYFKNWFVGPRTNYLENRLSVPELISQTANCSFVDTIFFVIYEIRGERGPFSI